MLTLKEFMEIGEYKVSEGSDYGWQCFGNYAYSLSMWNRKQDGWSMNIVFDTKDQTVYTVEVCDYANDTAYRIINPAFIDAYKKAEKDIGFGDEAWDGVYFSDLELDEDFVEKATAIVNDCEYDKGILVPVDLDDASFVVLAKMAHEQNITFNELVNNVLRSELDKLKKEQQ